MISDNDNLKILQDLTDSLNLRDAGMRKREQLFRKISKNIKDVITLHDAEGSIKYVSPSITDITGWKVEDLIDKRMITYVHPKDIDRILEDRSNLLAGNDVLSIYRFRKSDDTWAWVESQMSAIIKDGKVEELVVLTRDITKRLELIKTLDLTD
jgi:PAS domain S-box-containing protein